jgi:hypothetical protein
MFRSCNIKRKEIEMSSAILEILDKGLEVIGYGEYNGSSDSVPNEFVIDKDEIIGQKPYFLSYKKLDYCKHNDNIGVILFSNYGGGKYWPSKVCMKCRMITGITSPVEPDWGYHSPTDEDRKPYKELYDKGFPKDGDPRDG